MNLKSKKFDSNLLLFCILLLFAGCNLFGDADALEGLQVSGHTLRYGNRDIVLRGVVFPAYTELSRHSIEGDLATIQAWGGNAVRIIVDPCDWKENRSRTERSIQSAVDAALQAEIFPIVDWHEIGWPDGWSQDPLRYDTSFALAKDFWNSMADRFKDTRILFELWNEPAYALSDDPSTLAQRWKSLKPYFESLITLIRSKGNRNICIIAGSHYASDLRGAAESPLYASGVVYAVHLYPGGSVEDWKARVAGMEKSFPVLVTEWGFDRNATGYHYQGTPENYGIAIGDYVFDGLNLSAFAWGFHDYPRMGMFSDYAGQKMTEWGMFVKGRLGKISKAPLYPVEIRNSAERTGKLYLFQLYSTDAGSEHCHIIDGNEIRRTTLSDGLYLVNQFVDSLGWANAGAYSILVNGVAVHEKAINSHGHEMLLFRISSGHVIPNR
jgi:hypothetical protein